MIQVYTGDGKGKTTAALGLALRAAGHSVKTLIIQFMKSYDCGYGEHEAIKFLYPYVELQAFGRECFVSKENPNQLDRNYAVEAYEFFKKSLKTGNYRIFILDEICVALDYGLLPVMELIKVLRNIDKDEVEVVLTGRYAPKELLEIADLVTEFKEVKHYYAKEGIMGRKGIDW
ncbi:MAG: cob(I)yrinic acid a,c-diamide adenosyltransferase [bacterium]